jgi:hypothetical protein
MSTARLNKPDAWLVVLFTLFVIACDGASGPPAAPEDVAAARVCRTFPLYVEHKAIYLAFPSLSRDKANRHAP